MIRSRRFFIALVWIALVLIFPLYRLLPLHLGVYLQALAAPETLYGVLLTLKLSIGALLISSILALVFTIALHGVFTGSQGKTSLVKRAFIRGLEWLWLMPSFVYAFAVVGLFKVLGITPLYSFQTLLVGFILAGTPFLTIQLWRGLQDLDPREAEAFQSLGANSISLMRNYFYPKLKRVFSFALLQQLWLYFTSFSLVTLLSGGPPVETLEVSIYTSVRMSHLNVEQALAFASWQVLILISIRALLVHFKLFDQVAIQYQEWQSRRESPSEKNNPRSIWKPRAIGLGIWLTFIFIGAGMAQWGAVFSDHSTFLSLLSALSEGIVLSVGVSICTLLIAGYFYFDRLRTLADLGGWFSPMLLALIWWKAYSLNAPPLLLCVGVQVFLFLPWIARGLFPVLDRVRTPELEAMRSLGANPVQAWWRVEWPRIRGPVTWFSSVIFSLSLAEVSTVILFSKNGFEPIAVWIQNEMSRFRLQEASLGVIVLMSCSMFVVFGMRKNHE